METKESIYVCWKCRARYRASELYFIRCTECGAKVFFKAANKPRTISTD